MKTSMVFLGILLCLFWGTTEAQQVLSGSGTTFQNQQCTVSFTVGEAVVGNLTGSNGLVSQGFQQSWDNHVSIAENNQKNAIAVFPNPAGNSIRIKGLKSDEGVDILIKNSHGTILIQKSDFSDSNLDVSSLPKGFYIIQLRNGENRFIEKLIIE